MSDPNQSVLLDIAGSIAQVRFIRPAALNAIDIGLAQEFLHVCEELQRASDVRVIVLSGEGKAFMAGGDLVAFHANVPGAAETAKAIIGPLHAALHIMTQLPQPVICALQGAVAGAGVSIALACDFAIAADSARFALAYSRIGASLDAGCSWSLPRIVGLRKALELAILSELITADEALRLGLVNRVVPDTVLASEVGGLAERLAAGPTISYGHIKRLLRRSHGASFAEQLDAESRAFYACTETEDFAEGLDAFFGRRPAVFSGR